MARILTQPELENLAEKLIEAETGHERPTCPRHPTAPLGICVVCQCVTCDTCGSWCWCDTEE